MKILKVRGYGIVSQDVLKSEQVSLIDYMFLIAIGNELYLNTRHLSVQKRLSLVLETEET